MALHSLPVMLASSCLYLLLPGEPLCPFPWRSCPQDALPPSAKLATPNFVASTIKSRYLTMRLAWSSLQVIQSGGAVFKGGTSVWVCVCAFPLPLASCHCFLRQWVCTAWVQWDSWLLLHCKFSETPERQQLPKRWQFCFLSTATQMLTMAWHS